jgi:hypothetical protein
MKTIHYILAGIVMSATLFAQNGSFIASKSYVVFKDNSDAPKVILNFENNSSSANINVHTLSLIGAHPDEFNITTDGCSDTTLYPNQNCNVEVAFTPKNDGNKNALLKVPYGDSNTIYVFLTNTEDKRHNVIKRLAPILSDVNISEDLNASTSYDLTWSLIGYHHDYKVIVTMFDCTGMGTGNCGSSYSGSEKFLETDPVVPSSIESSDWKYYDQNASRFNYTCSVTIPDKRGNNESWNSSGTDIVVRFYVLSDADGKNHKSSLSLIVPGNLAKRYYDTSGRKIEKTVCPDTGCSDE